MTQLTNGLLFLVRIIFNAYLLIIMLRVLFDLFGTDYFNPISQFIWRVSNPPIKLIKKVIPNLKKFNMAALVLIIVLELVKLYLFVLIAGEIPNILGLFVWAFAGLLSQFVSLYFYLILFSVILSWIMPTYRTPISVVLFRLTDPILAPARKIIPPIAGLDLSPIVVIVILQLITIVGISTLVGFGMRLTFGY